MTTCDSCPHGACNFSIPGTAWFMKMRLKVRHTGLDGVPSKSVLVFPCSSHTYKYLLIYWLRTRYRTEKANQDSFLLDQFPPAHSSAYKRILISIRNYWIQLLASTSLHLRLCACIFHTVITEDAEEIETQKSVSVDDLVNSVRQLSSMFVFSLYCYL